jgi:hypothetical protein
LTLRYAERIEESDAKRFEALFDGRKDAYGVDRGGVVKSPLTTPMYTAHLRGLDGAAIGVFVVRDDATVTFAAIDLDEPDFDLAKELAELLPGHCWIEKSRSGNAHVWSFFSEPVPAWAARSVLRAATLAMGRPEVEVFPKQAALREGMVGNYINLPYFGESRPMVWQSGEPDLSRRLMESIGGPWRPYSLEAFLHDAEPRRNDPEEWIRRARAIGASEPQPADDSEFGTRASLHICAQHMLETKDTNPLEPGHRHVVLFNLAKMLLNCREYDEDDALVILEGYNAASTAPLGQAYLETVVDNAARGAWTSTGCDDPVMIPYIHPDCPIANAR